MDPLEVKFICCLKWLSGILKSRSPERGWQTVIDESVHATRVTLDLVQLFTRPSIYYTVYNSVIQPEEKKLTSDGSFWPLIQTLAHQAPFREYSVSDSRINHSILACTTPLNQFAHCVLIECIMSIYSSLLAPIGNIVKAIRKVSVFCASKELPSSIEEGLLLWINKIGRAALLDEQQYHQRMLRESDPMKRRRYRLKVLKEGGVVKGFPKVVNLTSSLSDGQCLAAVLIYYTKDKIGWSDFYFNHQSLTSSKALSNLYTIKSYCDNYLPLPSLHISPEIWLEHNLTSDCLMANVVAFLAFLFNTLDKQFVPGQKAHEEVHMTSNSTLVPDTKTSTPVKIEAMKRKAPKDTLLDLSLISDPSFFSVVNPKARPDLDTLRLRAAQGAHSLSTSALLSETVDDTPDTKLQGSLFPGAIRNPLLSEQTELLSSFKQTRRNPSALITPSVESLGIKSHIDHVLEQKRLSDANRLVVKDNIDENVQSEEVCCCELRRPQDVIKLKFVRPPSSLTDQAITSTEDMKETIIDLDKLHDYNRTVKLSEKETKEEEELVKDVGAPSGQRIDVSQVGKDNSPLKPMYLHIMNDTATESEDVNSLMLKAQLRQNVKRIKEKMYTSKLQQIKLVNERVFLHHILSPPATTGTATTKIAATGATIEGCNISRPPSAKGSTNNTRLPSAKGSGSSTRPPSAKGSGNSTRPPSSKGSSKITRPLLPAKVAPEMKSKDEVKRKRREEQIRARMEEREKERKNAIQERKSHIQRKGSLASTDTPCAVTILQTSHGKTNTKLIKNALCFVCLAGEADISMKQLALNELESSDAGHFMILFRDGMRLKFKGLYGYTIDHSYVKLFGAGPKSVSENMIEKLYKYNSGTKSFQAIPSHTFSLSVDAFTIQDHFWTNRRKTIGTAIPLQQKVL